MKEFKIRYKNKEVAVSNSWEALTPEQYIELIGWLTKAERGEMTADEVRCRLLCRLMDWDIRKIKDEESVENLLSIADQLTFLFTRTTDPDNQEQPVDRANLCFFAQLLPTVKIGEMTYFGYHADKGESSITTSLTALQYIEAREAMAEERGYALAAAILYTPQPYDSRQAQVLESEFRQLPADILRAIILNFQAVNTFLYTKTQFDLLAKFEPGKPKSISTDASDALYDLTKDGLGNVDDVEKMNVITYLKILRKKTIDCVRQMHGMEIDLAKIANETGLPISIITQII